MIDQLERWRIQSRNRDEGRLTFTGDDIKQMLDEIERLRADAAVNARLLTAALELRVEARAETERLQAERNAAAMAWTKLTDSQEQEIEQLKTALDKSVAFQSHYAGILNIYDGGKRMEFADREAWMRRLAETA